MVNTTARTESYRKRLLAGIERTPTIPMTVLQRYAVMLGYCVTGKRVSVSELHLQNTMAAASTAQTEPHDRDHVYRAERMLLRMVREGDLNSGMALSNAADVTSLQPYVPDPMGQAQIAYTILTSLCVRAAIEGGLSPDVAYPKGDEYIQKLFLTRTITEATSLKNQMYREFIELVHKCRANPQFTRPVQECRDYIELHAEEPLDLEALASHLGYSKYYLSRRVKEETGCTVNNYIQAVRVERAKMLLSYTDLSVAAIGERLCFATASHFSTVFKRLTGTTPARYREKHRNV